MRLPTVEQEIRDANSFKELYHFTFNYAKNPGQKGLDLEMAIAYWNIVLRGRFKFLDIWCQFLTVSKICDTISYMLVLLTICNVLRQIRGYITMFGNFKLRKPEMVQGH